MGISTGIYANCKLVSTLGTLTPYLQSEFARLSPPGWTCSREVLFLSNDLSRLLGYAPQADVLLQRLDGSRRLWIEFEVSRADPVANHAKFATAHLFEPQLPTDSFVAMVSSHVTRGRRNLAANTISLMRALGMRAFQTALLPHLAPARVKQLNQLTVQALLDEELDPFAELERALLVSEPVISVDRRDVHFASDFLEVLLNVRQWNEAILDPANAELWGTRTISYFVYDPFSRQFAPSKYCAFVGIPSPEDATASRTSQRPTRGMTMHIYVTLPGATPIFDGHRARRHLTEHLGMVEHTASTLPRLLADFERWVGHHGDRIGVHPRGPSYILPPAWFH